MRRFFYEILPHRLSIELRGHVPSRLLYQFLVALGLNPDLSTQWREEAQAWSVYVHWRGHSQTPRSGLRCVA